MALWNLGYTGHMLDVIIKESTYTVHRFSMDTSGYQLMPMDAKGSYSVLVGISGTSNILQKLPVTSPTLSQIKCCQENVCLSLIDSEKDSTVQCRV